MNETENHVFQASHAFAVDAPAPDNDADVLIIAENVTLIEEE